MRVTGEIRNPHKTEIMNRLVGEGVARRSAGLAQICNPHELARVTLTTRTRARGTGTHGGVRGEICNPHELGMGRLRASFVTLMNWECEGYGRDL